MDKKYKRILMCLLSFAALSANAADVNMTTSKAVGEEITIAVNAGVHAVITWEDGTTEEFLSDAQPRTITLKSQTFTLSSDDDITAIYVPYAGLTSIDVSKVRAKLQKLFVAGNELTSLDLGMFTALQELDCQGNNMTSLKLRGNALTYLNCSDNQLDAINSTLTTNLVELDCANNNITELPRVTKMAALQTLMCQNNKLTSLPLTASTKLETIVAFGNTIETLDGTNAAANLQNVWMGKNAMQYLDISATTNLKSIVMNDNQLDSIGWSGEAISSLKYCNIAGNKLYFKSMPTIYSPTSKVYSFEPHVMGPQEPFYLTGDVSINETQDWRQFLNYNAWGQNLSPVVTVTNGDGEELVLNTDYKNASRRFTFLTPQTGVQIHLTSRCYPDVELTSQPFNVVDLTGISQVSVDTEGDGAWYTIQGIRVDKPVKGIYIHNGKKVIIK